jgi:hypothetical protein
MNVHMQNSLMHKRRKSRYRRAFLFFDIGVERRPESRKPA